MKTVKFLLLSVVVFLGTQSAVAQYKIGGPHGCGINFSVNMYTDSPSFYVKVWEECDNFCPIVGACMEVVNLTTEEEKGVIETEANGVAGYAVTFMESMRCIFEVTISYKGYVYGKGQIAYRNGTPMININYL